MDEIEVEIALSAALAKWFAESNPDRDVETTRLQEIGIEEHGVMLTVGDAEFKITVESAN